MQLLPAISCGDAQWRLPLSDVTAVRLANAFLTSSESDRQRSLAQTLADDPALSLWIVSWAWTSSGDQPRTPGQLARWMTLDRWRRLAEHCEAGDATNVSLRVRWANLLIASLRARPCEAVDADEALPAMLRNAREWLAAADSAAAPDESQLRSILPSWNVDGNVDVQDREQDRRVLEMVDRWNASIPCAGELLANAMQCILAIAQRERAEDEHRLREKLASLKEFTYGASHELNNPLFNISSRAQVLMRDEPDPQRRKKLATIYSHAMRASEMINDIALAARPPAPQFDSVDALAVVEIVIDELQGHARQNNVALQLESSRGSERIWNRAGQETCPTTVEADATQLAVVIREICINAIESLGRADHGGKVRVQLVGSPDVLEIVIGDDGPGLDERSRRHLFDPFYSGYEAGRGFGFGLTKCWQIVDAHHGQIVVESQAGRGTTLTVRLPRRQTARAMT